MFDNEGNLDYSKLVIGVIAGINGEWYYRTKHSVWVMRTVDDTRKDGASMPVWVFVAWFEEKE